MKVYRIFRKKQFLNETETAIAVKSRKPHTYNPIRWVNGNAIILHGTNYTNCHYAKEIGELNL